MTQPAENPTERSIDLPDPTRLNAELDKLPEDEAEQLNRQDLIGVDITLSAFFAMQSAVRQLRPLYRQQLEVAPADLLDPINRVKGLIFYYLTVDCLIKANGYQDYSAETQTGLLIRPAVAEFYSKLTKQPTVKTSPLELQGVKGQSIPSAVYIENGRIKVIYIITRGTKAASFAKPHLGFKYDLTKSPDVFGDASIVFVTPFDLDTKGGVDSAMKSAGGYQVTHTRLAAITAATIDVLTQFVIS